MKHLGIEERHLDVYGADVSVFSDGSVHIHRSNGKRRFGNTSDKGYKTILIREGGKEHTVFVHRLIAKAFIPNPENKPQINHINGDKTDNRPENLEWCTNLENRRHRSEVLKHYGRRTPIRCVETRATYESTLKASNEMGVSRANIHSCLAGKRKSAGGYHWERV